MVSHSIVTFVAASSSAVIARTASLYIVQPFLLDCHLYIVTILALFILGCSSSLRNDVICKL